MSAEWVLSKQYRNYTSERRAPHHRDGLAGRIEISASVKCEAGPLGVEGVVPRSSTEKAVHTGR